MPEDTKKEFPKDFMWGASISAYQSEGGNKNQWTDWEHAHAEELAKTAEARLKSLKIWSEIKKDAVKQGNYLNGRGVARSDAVAASWLRKAAQAGVVEAANLLRMIGNPTPAAASCAAPAIFAAVPVGEPPMPPEEIRALVQSIAPKYGLEVEFVLAVIAAESAFNPHAISPKNAMGLMQLMPETAARFEVQHPFDPAENIRGGVAYLQWLLQRFAGRVDLALAAYNAGEGAVDSYGGIPPFSETVQYVARVQSFYEKTTTRRVSQLITSTPGRVH